MDMREKVIKGLETSLELGICGGCVNECWYGDTVASCKEIVKDALALLKAQEPVEPKIEQDEYPDCTPKGFELYYCGVCGDDIADGQKYCSNCGMAVKWNGR